jgi:hypothetical protein
MKEPREQQTTWAVYIFRKKGERLGTVEATGSAEALKEAIDEFEIREADRWHLSVQPA